MKKIIIMIIALFMLSGCYDYKEVNDLAIISAIGIDYQDNLYIVTLEVLNDFVNKEENITSYTVKGSASTLAESIENASDKLVNQANYSHVSLMILSESIITDKLATITDYFLRSTYFRENFYIVSAINTTPDTILNNKTKENPIASTAITELLEANDYSKNAAIKKTFDEFTKEIITEGIDTTISNINILDNNFIIDGMSLFSNYDFVTLLNNDSATIYNIIKGDVYRPIFSTTYDNLVFSVAIATSDIDITLNSDTINILGTITAKIMDNEANIDIRNIDELAMINEYFTNILNRDITTFIKELQTYKSDILGISNKYYQETRKQNTELWKYVDIKSNIEFQINKKGLIYEIKDTQ